MRFAVAVSCVVTLTTSTVRADLPVFLTTGHKGYVNCLAWSPDGKTLATGGDDGKVILWSVTLAEPRLVLEGHKDEVNALDFSPDGKRLASVSSECIVWELTRKKPIIRYRRKALGADCARYTPDGKLLAITSIRVSKKPPRLVVGDVSLLDAESGLLRATLPDHDGKIVSIAFAPDGSLIAVGTSDAMAGETASVTLWDLESKKRKRVFAGKVDAPHHVAFSPDGRTLAISSGQRVRSRRRSAVRLYDVANGKLKTEYFGSRRGTPPLAFSPSGQYLAVGSLLLFAEKFPKTDRAAHSAPDRILRYCNAVAFSPDGRILATAGWVVSLRSTKALRHGEKKTR